MVNGYPQVKLDNSDPQSGSRRWRARKSQENKLGRKTAHDDAIEQLTKLLAKVENITELAQLKQREIYNRDRAKAATKQLPISQQRKICEMAIELNEIATRANSLLSRLTARPNEFKTVEEVSLLMCEAEQLYDSNYKTIETIISGYCEQLLYAYGELIDSLPSITQLDSVNFNDVLFLLKAEKKRLGMNREDTKTLMLDRYSKSNVYDLTNSEIFDLLEHLKNTRSASLNQND